MDPVGHCATCGSTVPEGARFCAHCGRAFQEKPAPQPTSRLLQREPVPTTASPTASPASGGKAALITIVVIGLIATFVWHWAFWFALIAYVVTLIYNGRAGAWSARSAWIWFAALSTAFALLIVVPVSVSSQREAQQQLVRHQQNEQRRARAVANQKRSEWQLHVKRLVWDRAHPLEVARRKAVAVEARRQRAAERTRVAAVAVAQEHANQAAAARRRAAEASMYHGTPDCLVLDTRTLSSESSDYASYVTGKVLNQCDRDFGYVQVEINFYKGGSLANSGLANANNLAAGASWSFRAIATVEGSYTYRVEKVVGF